MRERPGKRGQLQAQKRAYHKPRLTIYGDVSKLTRAKNFTAPTLDGATGMWGPFTIPLRS